MNLTSPTEVKRILSAHGLHPKKRFGQNFLIDRNVLNRIVDAAGIGSEDNALEIGPGLGTVTVELAERAKRVVAVEMDREMVTVLGDTLAGYPNVEVVQADFLALDTADFLKERFGDARCTVVANLPYYITTPIITSLIDVRERLERIVLMVQKEVAARLRARPATEDYGSLSILLQYYCRVETVMQVSRNVFYPPPDVDSAVVRLTPLPEPAVKVADEALFFRIVRASFSQRRKTLLNTLSSMKEPGWSKDKVDEVLRAAGIEPARRGETLSLEELARITGEAVRAGLT
jgi:16S rRNA (adenine1518-N6/adenine1519-N6)-dimethyltransferase